MNKTVIIYASIHHKNTEKLLTEISKEIEIDIFNINKIKEVDFSKYETIGFASGIYMGKFHQSIYTFLENHEADIPKKTFVLCTSGIGKGRYAKKFSSYLQDKGFEVLGAFECKGFDTYGLFKFFGGLAKGHPNTKDIENAVAFVKNLEAKTPM
ncbi:flavodoxin [Treponema sp. OMZ 792]|uniref:flavodoxin domain-containing protein n=1 Tax=unclassified Treponema TaxID=2638727 RepID=UPI0020A37E3E|nr:MULTISPECIES: flavodoxin domain-containing protein [unclassified Treponema]UTC74898.1 flavodoxin [Treponema sp. OMZ 792]UTC81291.1 flavodoxin [Treponema sp. OMZ 798]